MHISSLQVWLGVNKASEISVGPVLPQYSFIELISPASNNTNFVGDPATDSSNYIYHVIYRQSDGKNTILKTDSAGVIQWQYLLTGSTYWTGMFLISSTNKIWATLGASTLGLLSPNGSIIQQKTFLSMGSRSNINSMVLDDANNIYIHAGVQRPDNYNTAHIYKLDSNGNWLWGSNIDPSAQMGDLYGKGLSVDSSGNVYFTSTLNYYDTLAGSYYYTGVIYKWNSSGTLQWQKRYKGSSYDLFFGSSGVDSSGNLYVKAQPNATAGGDIPQGLFKIDSTGAVVWHKLITWPPAGQSNVAGTGIQDLLVDSSGNCYSCFGPSSDSLTMSEEINGGSETKNLTYYIVKYNSSGVIQWQRKLVVPGISTYGAWPQIPAVEVSFDSTKQFLIMRVPNNVVITPGAGYGPSQNNWIIFKLPIDGTLMGTYTFNGKTIIYGAGSLTEHSAITINAPTNDTVSVTAVTESITSGAITTSVDTFTANVLLINYGVSPASSSVSEGNSLTFTVNTTNVTNGTVLYYNLSALSAATAADFTSYSGSFTISSNTGTFSVTLATDLSVESESFYMDIKTGSITGTIVGTSQMVSITDASPTYSLIPQSSSVSEGNSLNFTVNTTNVANGTVLYFNLNSSSSATAADFSAYTGSCTITSNTTSFTVTTITSGGTENEYFYMDLLTGSATGTIVATSSSITIIDTAPTYSITPATTTVAVGSSIIFNIATSYLPNGTVLTYTLGTGNTSDFSSTSGSVTINNNLGSFTITTLATPVSSIPYTFSMTLRSEGVAVATSSLVTTTGAPGTVTWKRVKYNNDNFVLSVGFVAASSTHAVVGQVSSGIDQVNVVNFSTGVATKVTLPNGTGSLIPSRGWYEQGKFTVIGTFTMDRRVTIWQCSSDPAVASNWTATNFATFFPVEYGFVNKGAWTFINNTYVMLVGTGSSPNGANEYIYYSSDGVNWSKSTVATSKGTADNASSLSMANNGSAILYHSRNLSGKIYYYNNNTFTTSSAFTQATPTTVVGAGYGIDWSKEAGWIIAPTSASAIRTTSLTTLSPATTIPVTGGAARVFATKPGSTETTRVIITSTTSSEVLTYSSDGGITWSTTSIPTSNLNGYTIDAGTTVGGNKIYLANGYYCYLYIGTCW